MQPAPVIARSAHAFAGEERAPAADRERCLLGIVAERDGVDGVVHHQFHARIVFELVADAREGVFLLRLAVRTAFEAHHVQAGERELLGQDASREAHPNHDCIDFLQLRDHGSLLN